MSRRCTPLLALTIAAATFPLPCSAQEVSAEDRAVARKLMANQGRLTPPLRPRCEAPRGNDIVVCAQDEEQFRAQSSSDIDPTSKYGTDDGRLSPPDVAGGGIFKGKATATICCAPPPAYMIDLASIPEAPAGSDADRIAKGEIRAP
ncbi:hypothetical protein ABVV53_00995 [Novosphingobium sp. RD2P27]|uniref:Uncharacterized protein n=1 Tax=Novosphingobium kalidii TaxID=3230299 RepID=A0ABV2CWS5_9SPHN